MTRPASSAPPLGTPVADWTPPPAPEGVILAGQFARLEPLDAKRHSPDLFRAFDGHDRVWDYLPYGPFMTEADYAGWVREITGNPALRFYCIRNLETGLPEGVASYLRIDPPAGSIEVGHINLSPALQRTRAATEAMLLMMRWAFDAGYRRYEWKCNALNAASRRAAQRLGFSYEGVFRNHMVVKARNRDTAWFAITCEDWPALRQAFETWLAPENFDGDGRQRVSLATLTAPLRVSSDPTL
ncbi:GNAT family protein [Sulfitobacter sp. D35]|uniref:GNAT family N-acetyltransferase n=1 Tax=Sulfitobacter sp. D35 TaxID=3083252 RepID=UPI00296E9182|nr:GNAT family protein [Sulfitobacter sp. D35]MDW4498991.1 GNAT family protein [Sulfitobacter sp. D35]